MTDMLNAALEYAAHGLPVFPCKHTDKSPLIKGGFHNATTDPDQIRAWWTRWPSAMIATNGIDVLDLDVKKGKNGFAEIPNWETLTPIVVRTPSDPSLHTDGAPTEGGHLWFKSNGIKNTTDQIALGVDTRGKDGYVIVPPSSNQFGSYRFEKCGLEWIPKLPEFPADLAARCRRDDEDDLPHTSAAEFTADLTRIAAAVEAIPNDDLDQAEWNRIGMAIWNASDGTKEGFEIFDRFSQKSKKCHNRGTARKRWRHYFTSPPDRVGFGTLHYEATKAKPDWERKLEDQIEQRLYHSPVDPDWGRKFFKLLSEQPQADVSVLIEPDVETKTKTEAKPPPREPQPPRSNINIKPLSTFKHGEVRAEAMRWCVHNRLPETGAGLLLGQWGMYKTFLALDLSAHVMLGWAWTGERIYRQGGVLLLAPEGANSIALRMAALVENKVIQRRNEIAFDPERLPFEWTNSCPPLLGKYPLPILVATAAAAAERFKREYDLPLVLVWIDTMATAAGWKDENDNAEASRAMAVLRDLSAATGAVVMGVDHLGKNSEAGARGASAKESNSDFLLTVTGNKAQDGSVKDTELVLKKLRDGPQGITIPFTSDLVHMGQDDHGELVTSRIINWAAQSRPKYRSENETLLEKVLNEVLSANGKMIDEIKMARRDDVRNAFRDAYKPEKENITKAAKDERFRKALKNSHGRITGTEIDGIEYLYWSVDDEV